MENSGISHPRLPWGSASDVDEIWRVNSPHFSHNLLPKAPHPLFPSVQVLKLGGHFAMEHRIPVPPLADSLDLLTTTVRCLQAYRKAFQVGFLLGRSPPEQRQNAAFSCPGLPQERGFEAQACSTEQRASGIHVRVIALKPGIQGRQAGREEQRLG